MTDGVLGVVWNPAKAEEPELRLAIDSLGLLGPVRWYATSEDDPGQGPARQALADGCCAIVIAGGDGSVRAVAEVLAGSGVPLGIVPSGTGNLLARNVGLPLNDLAASIRIAVSGQPRPIDVGWAEVSGGEQPGRHGFVVIAGFGIDSRMIVETDEDLKSKVGWLAYVASIGKAVASADVIEMTVRIDDAAPERMSAHTLMVGNCGTLQGGLTLLPAAIPDDGVLDLLVLSAESLPQWLGTLKTMAWDNGLLRLIRGDEEAQSVGATTHRTARRVDVEMEKPVTFQIDGDTIGDIETVSIEIDPGALILRRPAG